jgi:hypothetical protein
MAKAKKILGEKCCISRKVSSLLLIMGAQADVKTCCCKFIDDFGKAAGIFYQAPPR